MSGTDRAYRGRFGSAYAPEELYGVVRLVAQELRPDKPMSLTQAAFDAGAADVLEEEGRPAPPSARAITMRLKAGWKEILAVALTEGRDPTRTVAAAEREGWADHYDERHIYYALRRAAMHLEKDSFTAYEYTRARAELLEKASRYNGNLLAELMPSAGQIEFLAGRAGTWRWNSPS